MDYFDIPGAQSLFTGASEEETKQQRHLVSDAPEVKDNYQLAGAMLPGGGRSERAKIKQRAE